MKAKLFLVVTTLAAGALAFSGCGRQSRGNADAMDQSRAASPEDGGNSSTAGSAGQAKNFGDTSRSGASGGATASETPKQFGTPASNEPAQQPQTSTKDRAQKAP